MSKLANVQYSNDMIISINLMHEAVGSLECGKSAGPDSIFGESIKFSHHRIQSCTTIYMFQFMFDT